MEESRENPSSTPSARPTPQQQSEASGFVIPTVTVATSEGMQPGERASADQVERLVATLQGLVEKLADARITSPRGGPVEQMEWGSAGASDSSVPPPMFTFEEQAGVSLGPNQHTIKVNVDRAKLWKEEFEGLAIEREGDPNFPMMKERILKLLRTMPPVGLSAVRKEQSLVWLGFAFTGQAKRYLWQLIARYPEEDPGQILWRLEQRFYNLVHSNDLKMQWEALRMGDRESVKDFANRLSDLATCQSVVPSDHEMKTRFLSGLPPSLQEWSLLVKASFAETVSVTRKNAQKLARQRGARVPVDEVTMTDEDGTGSTVVDVVSSGTGAVMGQRPMPGNAAPWFWPMGLNAGIPPWMPNGAGTNGEFPGLRPGTNSGPKEKADIKKSGQLGGPPICWACKEVGHIKRDCPGKKKNDTSSSSKN